MRHTNFVNKRATHKIGGPSDEGRDTVQVFANDVYSEEAGSLSKNKARQEIISLLQLIPFASFKLSPACYGPCNKIS